MGDGHSPSHWNAGLTGQATRLAPLPLKPVVVARCCTVPGLWPLLRPPSGCVSPVSPELRCFLLWLDVFHKDHFPVRQGDTSGRSLSRLFLSANLPRLEPISTGGGGAAGRLLGSQDSTSDPILDPPGEKAWAEHI